MRSSPLNRFRSTRVLTDSRASSRPRILLLAFDPTFMPIVLPHPPMALLRLPIALLHVGTPTASRRNLRSPSIASYFDYDPDAFRKQLASQKRRYALRNASASSVDSTLSPPPVSRVHKGTRPPSHEPVQLPFPPPMVEGPKSGLRERERPASLKAIKERSADGGRSKRKLVPPMADSQEFGSVGPEMTYPAEGTANDEVPTHFEGNLDRSLSRELVQRPSHRYVVEGVQSVQSGSERPTSPHPLLDLSTEGLQSGLGKGDRPASPHPLLDLLMNSGRSRSGSIPPRADRTQPSDTRAETTDSGEGVYTCVGGGAEGWDCNGVVGVGKEVEVEGQAWNQEAHQNLQSLEILS